MNVMIIGAAGYVGRILTKAALKKNIRTTAVIRESEVYKISDFNLKIERREPLDPILEKIMEQHSDIVIAPILQDKIGKERRLAYKSIINKIKDSGIRNVIFLFDEIADFDLSKEIAEMMKKEDSIEWSIIIISKSSESGERHGNYKYEEYKWETIRSNNPVLLEDISDALIDELENKKNRHKVITIEYN